MARTAPPGLGLLKGLGITLKQMLTPASTQQYPHERPDLEPRTRGVIALMDENCTVCMLCSRECPDWCIYIDSHKETVPPAKEGGRARTRNVLDRFAIDFALCMYCGICVEVCPFDALWWSPEFEYAEYRIDALLHEMDRLREWMDTVPPPPPLDEGAVQPPEVADALAKAEQAALEAQKAAEEAEAKALEEQDGDGDGGPGGGAAAPKQAEVKVEAGEIDQETYDQLIAEGKSERIARAKAKAAYVRKAKQAAREAPAEADKPAAAEPEVHVEAGEIDTETFDQLIAEGKSERVARAKAKAAYVRKAKQAARAEAEADAAAPPASDTTASASGGTATEAPEEAPAAAPKKLADVEVDGEVEIDTETYDRLIAEGKSERIARAKAKAAYVKKRKQQLIDEGEA